MLHYKVKKENTSNEDAYKLPCCLPEPGAGGATNCDCCYDAWSEELIATSNLYKKWDAKVNKLQMLCTYESALKDRLKGWVADLDSTDENVSDVLRKIILFINQLNKICKVTTDSIRAVNILFCMVKDLYIRIDDLKKEYDELISCINNAGKSHPELGAGTAILVCLTEYGKKLQVLLDTRDGLIQSVANAIEIAHKLQEYICLNVKHSGTDGVDYALVNILGYWKSVFNGEHKFTYGPSSVITFPVKKSDYYDEISRRLEDVGGEKGDLATHRKELDHALDKKAGFQASMDGLKKALAEADPAIKCKP